MRIHSQFFAMPHCCFPEAFYAEKVCQKASDENNLSILSPALFEGLELIEKGREIVEFFDD